MTDLGHGDRSAPARGAVEPRRSEAEGSEVRGLGAQARGLRRGTRS